jgi:hypothetical protein
LEEVKYHEHVTIENGVKPEPGKVNEIISRFLQPRRSKKLTWDG